MIIGMGTPIQILPLSAAALREVVLDGDVAAELVRRGRARAALFTPERMGRELLAALALNPVAPAP